MGPGAVTKQARAAGAKATSSDTRERLRRHYRPERVRILFVGEAPPVSGRFFYRADSGLYRAVRDTFLTALPALPEDDFLSSFRALSCYLVDLCGEPVDQMDRGTRLGICRTSEVHLARTIEFLRPAAMVTLVRSIRANVERAQDRAGWSGLHLVLPYPGRWKHHRMAFQRGLVPLLREILSGD
jgi:hypothetical protein